jgi:hypothetical protein
MFLTKDKNEWKALARLRTDYCMDIVASLRWSCDVKSLCEFL